MNNNRFCKSSNTLDAEDTQFELFAIIVHVGTLEQGHYLAYTKRNQKWYLFNDEEFYVVKESEALE